MFLAIDVGNTHTVLGLVDQGKVFRTWRVTTGRYGTADELAVTLRHLDGLAQVQHWTGGAVCSVVPAFNRTIAKAAEMAVGCAPLVLHGRMNLGLKNEYENPNEVGMDRLANAVAGVAAYGPALAIVDFGTATTIDFVSDRGSYLGGCILPGLEATADALYRRTSQLPQIAIERPSAIIGRNTVQSMRSGIYWGAVEGVDGLIRRAEAELGYPLRIIATGGLSNILKIDMPRCDGQDEHLTLLGIHAIWEKNRS